MTTLNPGDPATVQTSFEGSAVRLTLGIPRGSDGLPGPLGPQGPPGELTNALLQAAIDGSSTNSNSLAALSVSTNPSYEPAQWRDIIAKLNELISALRR